MSVVSMLRRSGSMTLVVYACHTLAAALSYWPLGSALSTALADAPRSRAEDAALVLELGARGGPQLLGWALACGVSYALLSPLLTLAWLHALGHDESPWISLRRGFSSYLPALALGTCALCVCATTLGLAALALEYGPQLLPATELAESAWRVAVVSGTALSLLFLATAYDLSRAALSAGTRGIVRALLAGLHASRLPQLVRHALIALAIVSCFVLAEATARLAPDSGALGFALAAQQALVFVATALRAAWLALALQSVSRR